MSARTAQRTGPTPDMTRSLGSLLVAAAQLRHEIGAVVGADDAQHPSQATEWLNFARHLLEMHDRIVAAVSTMRFTGSSAEHPLIRTDDDVVIPADAGYVSVLARRMEKHTRIGRLLALSPEDMRQLSA